MDERITNLAEAQHGVVSRQQLLAAEMCTATVDAAVNDDRLVRVARGVYSVPGAPSTARSEAMVAALRCGPDAVVVGERMLAICRVVGANLEGAFTVVTRPGRRLSNVPWGWRRRPADWPARRATVDAIPSVDVPWNLVEAAVDVSDATMERLADGVRWRGRAAVKSVVRILRAHSHEHAGARRLDRSGLFADDAPQSPPERRVEGALAHHGPRPQAEVLRGCFVDLLLPAPRIVLEYQGFATHSSRRAREQDADRRRALEAAGYLVVPVVADDLLDLAAFVAKIDLLVEVRMS